MAAATTGVNGECYLQVFWRSAYCILLALDAYLEFLDTSSGNEVQYRHVECLANAGVLFQRLIGLFRTRWRLHELMLSYISIKSDTARIKEQGIFHLVQKLKTKTSTGRG